MVINNELKFAEKVILIDAAYINKVTKDLSQHFGQLIGRELPKADLPIFLECVAMDAASQPGENVLQVLFVYDKNQTRIDAFNPSDLKKELNDVAFKSQLGEFQLNTFEPSDMADKEAFFLESVRLVADAKEVKHLVVVPSEMEYGDELPEIFEKGGDPVAIVEERGLGAVSDTAALEAFVDQAIAANPGPVEDFKNGKKAAAGFFVGQVMKLSKGKADPKIVGGLVAKKLSAL